jgi:hypothetical protein
MAVMINEKPKVSEIDEGRVLTPVHPGSETLRRALRGNIVSFPSQIPPLLKCPPADAQWRIVLLFFVRGWSSSKIAARFSVPRHRIWKILNGWSVRALALGYIQVIDQEAFAACCHLNVECGTVASREEVGDAAKVASVPRLRPRAVPAAAAGGMSAAGIRPGNSPAAETGASLDLVASLDAAIAECEAWREEFRVRTAALLHDLKAAAAALDRERRDECEEERASHAVA